MANILLDVAKGVEVAAEHVLSFITGTEAKVEAAAPGVVAGLGVLLGTVDTALSDTAAAASSSGLNIALDQAVVADLKSVWPAIKSFASTLNIKL